MLVSEPLQEMANGKTKMIFECAKGPECLEVMFSRPLFPSSMVILEADRG